VVILKNVFKVLQTTSRQGKTCITNGKYAGPDVSSPPQPQRLKNLGIPQAGQNAQNARQSRTQEACAHTLSNTVP
jgi:hypothetical protein